jgi:cell filamentation protein, protein adenylyltransferase
MYVKKVETYKSGKFAFSRMFSLRKINPLRIEAQILYETIKDLPILPQLATSLEQELIQRSIHGTAAIEGNPLTEDRVSEIIAGTDLMDGKERAEQEILNLKAAYAFVKELKDPVGHLELTETFISDVHRLITLGIDIELNNPGVYRNHKVQVGDRSHGGVYAPPKCLPDIKNLMTVFCEWINSEELVELYPPIRAALAHYYLGLVHPFGDGNGRTVRIIEAVMMRASGIKYVPIMLSNYYYRNMDEYFSTFSKTIKSKDNDVTPFLRFALNGFIASLRELKEKIIFYIRKFSLRDYYEYLKNEKLITRRQHDLLIILLETQGTFSLNDLFTNMPFKVLYRNVSERTARRDLTKLSSTLLNNVERNKYELNWRTLE